MRGETATENVAEAEDYGENAASGERRASIVKLQHMLRRVSQSPFHSQYKALVSSASDSSGSSTNDPQTKQDGDVLADLSGAATEATDHQNGVSEDLPRTNPFYTYYLDSGSKGHMMEDVGRKTSEENLDTIVVPPPEFQSSPLEYKTHISVENGAEPQIMTPDHAQDFFQTSTWPSSANGHFEDLTLNSPDLFTPDPPQTNDLSKTTQLKSSGMVRKEGFTIFQDEEEHTGGVNLFDRSDSVFVDPFKSPSANEVDPFGSPQAAAAAVAVVDPFHTATTGQADLFQTNPTKGDDLFQTRGNQQDLFSKENLFSLSSNNNLDIFSPSSSSTVDPFPSPITRDLFQDVSGLDDPFSPSPAKQHNHFQDVSDGTADVFQPLPSKASSTDIFAKPSLSGPTEVKSDIPEVFNMKPSKSPPAVPPKPSVRPRDIVLTTPEGSHHVLQPTPFTRARNLSMSPSQPQSEMTHVSTFRRPPRPLPRTRPPSKEKPPRPERPPKPVKPPSPANPIEPEAAVTQTSPKPPRPFPKPVIHRKPKTPENKPTNPTDYVVFEDILLIGQERCVEDWPEDSPELHPDFKPSGTLRLRRESLKMRGDSDGGSGEDQDGGQAKKKDKKFRMSLLSRRGSKEKFDDTKEGKSRTLPTSRKSSKEYFSDPHMFPGETEDGEQNAVDKKKHLTTKVNQLMRRASTTSSVPDGKHMNGFLPQESKEDNLNKKSSKKNSIRRWSEGPVLDDSTGEEEEEGGSHEEVDSSGFKRKKKVKIRFVPHRGFAIIKTDDEPQGAHGYTPRKGSKDDAFENVEELKNQSRQSPCMAAFVDDEHLQKSLHPSVGLNGDADPYGIEDHKPKKTPKMKLLHRARRSSKEDMLDHTSSQKKKSSFSGEELDEDQFYKMEDCKPKKPKFKVPVPAPRKTLGGQSEPVEFNHHTPQQANCEAFPFEDDVTEKDFMDPRETYEEEQDELETCKPKKLPKRKGLKKHKNKSKYMDPEWDDPPGATSSDYMSEAAKAEWMAAQMDERAMAGLEDEDEEGDTDSLMEWWYTVEQWDEVPSDDEDKIMKEDVSKSFTVLADKVQRGLRVFNKVFTERAEVLWQYVIRLHAIADDISNFHQKAKIAGITGGTTTAVGGVTAIAGLALAPFTFGASLVITAVGVGVATAGGITSASAAISDNVNNMHDRKKVEVVLQEYEAHLLDIGKILHFVNEGVYKLRGHPFLRTGTQHYSEDWEVRRAVQMISLVDSPVMRATEIADTAVVSVQGLFKGMDKYFIKDSRELKKGCKKEVVAQIKEVANVLNDGIVELNAIREELQDATGNM